ncbi:hypothetical protein [Deinococcus sonorensis]|uniref:Lipoprotein n=2 Tax=Deinococcus sonorensis TaxID=309891 RepID=A0AAU7UBW3_9DEIO
MKKRLYVLSAVALPLVLTACPGPAVPTVTPITEMNGRIQGQDALTSGGTASVQLVSSIYDLVFGVPPMKTAPVAADGSFTLTLPTAAEVAPRLQQVPSQEVDSACSGRAVVTPATANFFEFGSLFLFHDGQPQAELTSQDSKTTQNSDGSTTKATTLHSWLYVDVPTHMSVDLTCPQNQGSTTAVTVTTQIELTLQSGWNALTVADTNVTFPDGHQTMTEKVSKAANAPTVWTAEGINAMALAQSGGAATSGVSKGMQSHSTFFHRE